VQRFGFHQAPTTIVVTFSEALDRSTAEDVRNYRIVDPEGHRIKVTRAVYNPANRTVTLHLAQRLSIHHPYRLTVIGKGPQGISNSQHQLLESQAAGQPGGDFHLRLTWRQLVLGDVSRQFLHRYHILPKGERTGAHSADSRPGPRAHQPVLHSPGLFTRSISFPAHHSQRSVHGQGARSVVRH
jgi:hypothetical protein